MLTIRWLGQAGYILADGKTTICIDPYLSDVVNRVAGRPRLYEAPVLPQELKCNAMICTHNHLDHVDVDAIPLMNKSEMTFYAPTDCRDVLLQSGVTQFLPFDVGSSYQIGEFKITAVFANHTVPAVGVVIEHSNQILYFTSDTLYDSRLSNVKCDILFICINGKLGNMNVDEAICVTDEIKPITAIPNHYDMFESNSEDPTKFTEKEKCGFIMKVNKLYEVKNGCLI